MKKLRLGAIALALAVVGGTSTSSSAQLLAYDGFGNGPLNDLSGSNGGTGWAGDWTDVMFDQPTFVTSSGGLTHTGLLTTAGTAKTNSGSGAYPISRYFRAFPALPPGTTAMYVSFLLRADPTFGTYGGVSFGTWPFAMLVGSPLGMYSYGMMLSEGLGDITNAPVNPGQTALIVVRISKNTPASGITYKMYLNPNVGNPEPSFAQAQYSVAPVNVLPGGINIDNEGGFTTDEIRMGLTWQSVLPAPVGCVGDFNHSHMVDGADLSILLGQWGLPGADLNADGTTDAADLAILLGAWGLCPQ